MECFEYKIRKSSKIDNRVDIICKRLSWIEIEISPSTLFPEVQRKQADIFKLNCSPRLLVAFTVIESPQLQLASV